MDEFAKRISDLQQRSRDRNMLTHTTFLTPAEAYEVRGWNIGAYLSGGGENCEREMAFFLPEYIEPENLDIEEYIAAVKVETKFASPSHRDFLGSFLGLGVNRDAVGDIIVTGDGAYIYCLPSVAEFAALNLTKVGRAGAKTERVSLDAVPVKEIKKKEIKFSVMSPRLDAAVSGMFNLSRATASKLIDSGLVSLNYKECLKADKEVREGDIISARGYGKGVIKEQGGTSRRGRTFISADIFK